MTLLRKFCLVFPFLIALVSLISAIVLIAIAGKKSSDLSYSCKVKNCCCVTSICSTLGGCTYYANLNMTTQTQNYSIIAFLCNGEECCNYFNNATKFYCSIENNQIFGIHEKPTYESSHSHALYGTSFTLFGIFFALTLFGISQIKGTGNYQSLN
jgi:hypothetical protein